MVLHPRLGKRNARPALLRLLGAITYLSCATLSFAPGLWKFNQVDRARPRVALNARGGEAGNLAKGDMVKALCPDDDTWYPGMIESLVDGEFVVKWDDPDGGPESHQVAADAVKKVIIFQDYKVGETVHAVFPDDGNYYPGEVTKINDDGTFTVKWEDPDGGPEETDIEVTNMKYPPIPFEELEIGNKYTGTASSIREFGAFVDIGSESEGLLHISQISEERVDNVEDFLQVGQDIEVWITRTQDDGKFGVTMVESLIGRGGGGPRPPADLTPFQGLSSEEWFDGTVASIRHFGAIVTVTLEDGASADGLVHVSQIKDGFVDNVDDELSVGQEVQVRVTKVEDGKMSLSMRQGFSGRPSEDIGLTPFADISSDTWLTGKVERTAPFGAFVSIQTEDGASAQGLVHITQIRDGFVENVDDELSPGQEVQVRIESVDVEEEKMLLSMKDAIESEEP